jgi:hypothetical protein
MSQDEDPMSNQSSDDAIRALLCVVEGENGVFEVQIAADKEITHLKEIIHKKGINVTSPILAKDLTLLKVTTTQSPA